MRRGSRLREALWTLSWPLLVLAGVLELKRTQAELIITIFNDGTWITAAYAVSRITGVPLLYYVHDEWSEQVSLRLPRLSGVAEDIERLVLEHATVVVLSQALGTRYQTRYGVESSLVRHMASGRRYEAEAPQGCRIIGFAGAVYDNNSEQLRDLAGIIGRLKEWRLRLYTDAPPKTLERLGLRSEAVATRFVPDTDDLRRELSRCNVLYLPLAFKNTQTLPASLLSCAVPTKTVDYLMSGAPILVHCPGYYELATLVEGHGVGTVFTSPDTGALENLLRSWTEEGPSAPDRRCRDAALSEFDAEKNLERFLECARRAVERGRQ